MSVLYLLWITREDYTLISAPCNIELNYSSNGRGPASIPLTLA